MGVTAALSFVSTRLMVALESKTGGTDALALGYPRLGALGLSFRYSMVRPAMDDGPRAVGIMLAATPAASS